jgi:hypothetical protein
VRQAAVEVASVEVHISRRAPPEPSAWTGEAKTIAKITAANRPLCICGLLEMMAHLWPRLIGRALSRRLISRSTASFPHPRQGRRQSARASPPRISPRPAPAIASRSPSVALRTIPSFSTAITAPPRFGDPRQRTLLFRLTCPRSWLRPSDPRHCCPFVRLLGSLPLPASAKWPPRGRGRGGATPSTTEEEFRNAEEDQR